jgi:hypothetical protein
MGGSNFIPQGSSYTQGFLSNFRFVNGTAVYSGSGNFTPPTAVLTAVTNTALLTCQANRFIDSSTNNFAVTRGGTPLVKTFSPFNPTSEYSASTIKGSGYCDGPGDYISASTNSAFTFGTSAFQVEFWYYPTATPDQWDSLFSTLSNSGIFFACRSGYLDWTNNYDQATLIRSTWPSVGSWHHIVLMQSGGTRAVFIDGVRQGTAASDFSWDNSGITFGENAAGYFANARIMKGSVTYDPSLSTLTVPTTPVTAVSGTVFLCDYGNAGIVDLSTQNDIETVGTAQISTSVKKYGSGSLSFDGSGDWLTIPYNPTHNFGTGDFTIEGWFYLNSLAASYYVPCGTWSAASSDEWLIQIQNNGSIRFLTTAGSTFYSAGITSSTWYHIAAVRSGSTLTLYVNGTSVGSYTCTNSIGSTSKTLYVGTQGGTWDWNGYIDDFRITNGYARYTSNFTPPTLALPTY